MNCVDTCKLHNLECTEKQLQQHNVDVDSSDELLSLIESLGGTTSAHSCSGNFGTSKVIPHYNPTFCLYSDSTRSLSTYDCGKTPADKGKNRRRLCWCHAPGKLDII